VRRCCRSGVFVTEILLKREIFSVLDFWIFFGFFAMGKKRREKKKVDSLQTELRFVRMPRPRYLPKVASR
jgi:hypothetical protein